MDKREALKSMLNNLINDKPEEAALDLHGYMTVKMQEISGIGKLATSAPTDEEQITVGNESETE
jgi:hypothetical protein